MSTLASVRNITRTKISSYAVPVLVVLVVVVAVVGTNHIGIRAPLLSIKQYSH